MLLQRQVTELQHILMEKEKELELYRKYMHFPIDFVKERARETFDQRQQECAGDLNDLTTDMVLVSRGLAQSVCVSTFGTHLYLIKLAIFITFTFKAKRQCSVTFCHETFPSRMGKETREGKHKVMSRAFPILTSCFVLEIISQEQQRQRG
jgi:hypothetical protein